MKTEACVMLSFYLRMSCTSSSLKTPTHQLALSAAKISAPRAHAACLVSCLSPQTGSERRCNEKVSGRQGGCAGCRLFRATRLPAKNLPGGRRQGVRIQLYDTVLWCCDMYHTCHRRELRREIEMWVKGQGRVSERVGRGNAVLLKITQTGS